MLNFQASKLEFLRIFQFLLDIRTMQNSEFFTAVPVDLSVEQLKQLTQKWGSEFRIAGLTAGDANTLFTSLRRGLQHAGASLPNCGEWAHAIEQLRTLDLGTWAVGGIAASQTPAARLSQLLITQPSTFLTEHEQKQCLALASVAFISAAIGQQPLQDAMAHGLAQQFKSQHPGWQALRARDCLDKGVLKDLEKSDFIPVVAAQAKMLAQLS